MRVSSSETCIAAVSCAVGALGCEALLDFEGLEYAGGNSAHGGGPSGGAGGVTGGGGAGAGAAGGVGGDCLVDASRSDDFLSILIHREEEDSAFEIAMLITPAAMNLFKLIMIDALICALSGLCGGSDGAACEGYKEGN